jgi:hypothetical protein
MFIKVRAPSWKLRLAPRQIALGTTQVAYELMRVRVVAHLQRRRSIKGVYGEA